MFTRTIGVLLVLAAIAAAQPRSHTDQNPPEVSLCELIHHAKSYAGQMIRVRGHVIFEFENFSLDDSACGDPTAKSPNHDKGVWLTFGGDEPELATYCCGSHSRTKGTNLEIAGHRVPLVRDAEFQNFLYALQARRLRRPDGKECGRECKLYEVTATLTGLLSPASAEGGYGHFGMFHLLAISQVSHVASQRNPVTFGGTFACSSQTWEPTPKEAMPLDRALRCTDVSEAGCTSKTQFSPVAAHWNEDVSTDSTVDAYTDADGNQIANLVSTDLLTSYFTKVKNDDVSIAREHCTPVSLDRGPVPSSVSVACDNYEKLLDESVGRDVDSMLAKDDFPSAWSRMADGARLLFVDGDQSWRVADAKVAAWHVLREQAQQWHLALDLGLEVDKCQDSSLDDTPIFISCNWYSPDGTQAFDVSLLKERRATDKLQSAPWLVTRVSAAVCRPDKE